jgi:hypothetical protein
LTLLKNVEVNPRTGKRKYSDPNNSPEIQKERNSKSNPINNIRRMYVDGNHISVHHPLYKPGRYKSFNEAMFASITKDKQITEGNLYLITNPYFASLGWYKLGKAVEVDDRCNSYQTGTPFRDYYIIAHVSVTEYSKAETEAKDMAHKISKTHDKDANGEWFDAELKDLLSIINTIGDKYNKTNAKNRT